MDHVLSRTTLLHVSIHAVTEAAESIQMFLNSTAEEGEYENKYITHLTKSIDRSFLHEFSRRRCVPLGKPEKMENLRLMVGLLQGLNHRRGNHFISVGTKNTDYLRSYTIPSNATPPEGPAAHPPGESHTSYE
jgi:hypothetical protein